LSIEIVWPCYFLIEVPVPGQEIDPACIYVLDVSMFICFYDWIVEVF
jgi:hypothetical protein